MENVKDLIASGNTKLPKTTAIFNMSSATDCPSLKKGLCSAIIDGKIVCYALRPEKFRPTVLPYRKRQEKYWKDITAEKFVEEFITANARKRKPYNAIRFNEAGDFHTQKCITKAEKIATMLKPYRIKCYTYTARKDLSYKKIDNLVVNGSGFMRDNIKNEFKIVKKDASDKPADYALCVGDCKICSRCMVKGMKTAVQKH